MKKLTSLGLGCCLLITTSQNIWAQQTQKHRTLLEIRQENALIQKRVNYYISHLKPIPLRLTEEKSIPTTDPYEYLEGYERIYPKLKYYRKHKILTNP